MRTFRMNAVPLMRPTLPRLLLPAFLLATLAGCSTTRSCGGNEEYLQAVERPPLSVPADVALTERASPMAIPAVAPDPVKLDPQPRCLDEPPQYFARQGTVADPAEEAVRAWATAWAERKPEAVVALYSPAFQAPGEGGSAAFLETRAQQVASGRAPAASLEELTVDAVSADRRVVTFIQRFGDDGVRKELTLVREGQAWHIIAERTIEVL
jgi:hypothetical protein